MKTISATYFLLVNKKLSGFKYYFVIGFIHDSFSLTVVSPQIHLQLKTRVEAACCLESIIVS